MMVKPYSLLERAALAVHGKFNNTVWPYGLVAIYNCRMFEENLSSEEIEEYHEFLDKLSDGKIPRVYEQSFRDKVLNEVQSKFVLSSSVRSDVTTKVCRIVESLKDNPNMGLWEQPEFNDHGAGI